MEFTAPLQLPDSKLIEVIQKDLNEDPERLERQVELFKEWLKCETHLPKDIDDHLILNFVRLCKCDLDKAKRKFENFLASRLNWKQIYSNKYVDETYFSVNNVHKEFAVHPKLTPDGCRVVFYRLPPLENYDFDISMRYSAIMMDYLLFEDTSASQMMIYDFEGSTPQHISKINIKNLLRNTEMIYKVSPFRVKHVHVLNLPKSADVLFNIVLKVASEKVAKRITIHKDPNEITNYLPMNILPDVYGGKGGDLDKYGGLMRDFLLGNDKFVEKIDALKLTGPIPPNKASVYSFEDYEMEGSFRQLNID